jgi:hypothetical protein
MLLLAIWLILGGLMPLLNLSFSGASTLNGDPRDRRRRVDLGRAIAAIAQWDAPA